MRTHKHSGSDAAVLPPAGQSGDSGCDSAGADQTGPAAEESRNTEEDEKPLDLDRAEVDR